MDPKSGMPTEIFVLNAGSSSLKFGLYRLCSQGRPGDTRETLLARGTVEAIGKEKAAVRYQTPANREPVSIGGSTLRQACQELLALAKSGRMTDNPDDSIQAVGCRVVHGGARFTEPTQVSAVVLEEIRSLASLAPLHNPIDADAIEAAMTGLPDAPVFAVFDTAFHHTLPDVASTYALPSELCRKHSLQRYGFHGISHRYVSERLLECMGRSAAGSRLITCHLGNGASLCALRDGRSMDTSMGLTPLEGLVMGTRSGDIDPGLLLYLLRSTDMNVQQLDDLLNHQSGLLGVSGRSGDVRDLEQAAREGDSQAELALELFAYRASKYIGAYAVALEGVDAIAFTAGIGEHSASMRSRICRRLAFLGIRLDEERNRNSAGGEPTRISADDAAVQTWIVPTDEERQIAREVYALLSLPAT